MKKAYAIIAGCTLFYFAVALAGKNDEEALARHRNLGKAFYENPTTQAQAVDEFRKALALAPGSARERINHGLALLRAGKTEEGMLELEKAQKQDPAIPHTWFNLGVVHKKDARYDEAIQQFEGMERLVPDEPITLYNLGVLFKLTGKADRALSYFEKSSRLSPNLAGPHFQLYNAYRQMGRAAEADVEQKQFQELKKKQAGAAIPEDLEWSYYAEIYETIEPRSDEGESGVQSKLKFHERILSSGIDASSAGMCALDADGDGVPDLLVWSANGVKLLLGGTRLQTRTGLEELKGVVSIAAGDFNNDGLPDLAVVTSSAAFLFVNRKGVFEKASAQLPAGRFAKPVWIDFDHDYDLDLILLGETQVLLRNNGPAGFSDETASFPFRKGKALDGVLIDTVADTDGLDLVVSYAGRAGVIYRDLLGGKYQAEDLSALQAGSNFLSAVDSNNDGWTDLMSQTGSCIAVFLNRGGKLGTGECLDAAQGGFALADFWNRGFADVLTSNQGIVRNLGRGKWSRIVDAPVPKIMAAVASDFDRNGSVDLAVVKSDGTLSLLLSDAVPMRSWVAVRLQGVKNQKLALGAKVEIKAGVHYQKQIYLGAPLHFGLGNNTEVDAVRITWPNGMIQNAFKQPVRQVALHKEAPRLSGSCPMIYTWNGSRFEFLTDVLGVAPLGASAGDGTYFIADHDEYVRIPAASLALGTDGSYRLRMTEELREVTYLDQLKFFAVDHPATIEVFSNEKFKAPPFPEFRMFGVSKRIYPRSARDEAKRDVLPSLLHSDQQFAGQFRRDYAGRAEMHHLDLDFGDAAKSNRAVLVLNGWVDWADGSTFRAAAQERQGGFVSPYLQVKDAAGKWQTVVEDMGLPSGKPKPIVVDLTGKFQGSSREVRIVTNVCVYWDEIFLGEDSSKPEMMLSEMPANMAELAFHGFSKPTIDPERRKPETFDYQTTAAVSSWNPIPGKYTRYGTVGGLLKNSDDRMVVMGAGDELQLSFDARGLAPVARGWTRDFLLYVDGWAKDGDPNTAYATTVEPLPFHAMKAYPYLAQRFPDDATHRDYVNQFNIRPALRLMRPLTPHGGAQ